MLAEKIQEMGFKLDALGEQVSRILVGAILDDVLKGGQQLVETDLQKQFGVSRSPLREAFRDLEKKGLLVIIPRKGSFVREVTADDIAKTYSIRAVLEAIAAGEAHERITSHEVLLLRSTLDQMEECFSRDDTRSYWRQHFNFHETFINASGNEVLIDILANLRLRTHRYRFSQEYYRDHFASNIQIHREICDLLTNPASDADELMNLVKNHIEEASRIFIANLGSSGKTPERPDSGAP
jgi:DNA-binding GntR family transcriptional regulator